MWLLPIGTVHVPFIARGLDALNYGCYQDARFLLVATPSEVILGPNGGAHQSINSPLIGIGQPGLTYHEPAFADELALIMGHAFRHLQAGDGNSVYVLLTTRAIAQVARVDTSWEADALRDGYWLQPPRTGPGAALMFIGAIVPEVLAAFNDLADDIPGLGVLAVTSPDLLHRGWAAAQASRWTENAQLRAMSKRCWPHSRPMQPRQHYRRVSVGAGVARRRARSPRRGP